MAGSAVWPPAAPVLLWGTVAVALVALGYAWLGPAVFGKHDGRLSAAATFLLAPYLLGASLSFRRFRHRDTAYDEVAPDLLVGRRLDAAEAAEAVAAHGIATVVDLTAEFPETRMFRTLSYLNVPILDLTPPTPDELHAVCRFIDSRIGAGPVYLHCALGYSRSAVFAAAYLLHAGHCATVRQAIETVRRARPKVVLNDTHLATLSTFLAVTNRDLDSDLRAGGEGNGYDGAGVAPKRLGESTDAPLDGAGAEHPDLFRCRVRHPPPP
jgi:protein-tyrosine phosphatase